MSFIVVLSWIFEKNGLNHKKYGQAIGVLRGSVETHATAKSWHATPRRGREKKMASLGFVATKLLFTA